MGRFPRTEICLLCVTFENNLLDRCDQNLFSMLLFLIGLLRAGLVDDTTSAQTSINSLQCTNAFKMHQKCTDKK